MIHSEWMCHALRLAERGTGKVSPNPRVGCVIVDNDGIIAEGWHQRYGEPHAEAHALSNLTRPLTDHAVLYVNLEPCSHTGKTPPCADAIIASGIKRVVVGMVDPNPLVSGKGIERLRAHGVDVIIGVEEDACRWLNRSFIKYISSGMPYVVLKVAMSVDGTIAPEPRSRYALTGDGSQRIVHALRAELDAVMVGGSTVSIDDPFLSVRSLEGRDPVRIILDSTLAMSVESHIVRTARSQRTIIYTSTESERSERAKQLRELGAEIRATAMGIDGHLDLSDTLRDIGSIGIASVLVEAGPALAASFLRQSLVDEFRLHKAAQLVQPGHGLGGLPNRSTWTLHSMQVVESDVLCTYVASPL